MSVNPGVIDLLKEFLREIRSVEDSSTDHGNISCVYEDQVGELGDKLEELILKFESWIH